MELDNLLTTFLSDLKNTDDYKNLSAADKLELDNILASEVDELITTTKKERKKSQKNSVVYQLKVSLKGIRPPIWRRILVPSHITFDQLHKVIQIAMGWDNYHLYSFEIGLNGVLIELPDEANDFGSLFPSFREKKDSRKEQIKNWINEEKQKITYTYDFGDDWEHTILLERIDKSSNILKNPICLKGKRACPPEDVGGVYGYSMIIDMLQGNNNEEIEDLEELQEWYGDFEPEEFDLEFINSVLKDMNL